jgi:hypothetical protein
MKQININGFDFPDFKSRSVRKEEPINLNKKIEKNAPKKYEFQDDSLSRSAEKLVENLLKRNLKLIEENK